MWLFKKVKLTTGLLHLFMVLYAMSLLFVCGLIPNLINLCFLNAVKCLLEDSAGTPVRKI